VRFIAAAGVAMGLVLAPLAAAAGYGRPAQLPLAQGPDGVLIGDVTQDGTVDIVTMYAKSSTIGVLPGVGDASFERRVDFPGVAGARAAVLGDFDTSGSDDLAVAAGTTVTIFAGNGGGLEQQSSYPAGSPAALALADIDVDGVFDLVASSSTAPALYVLRGLGDGTFEPAVTYQIGSPATSIVVTELNGDEVADLAAAGSSLSVLVADGEGGFEPYRSYAAGLQARSLDAQDLDYDDDTDLVAAAGPNQVAVLLNSGEGDFPDLVSYTAGAIPVRAVITEVDDDENVDVLTANRGSDDLSALLGRGDGTFAPQTRIKVGRTPTGLALDDLNLDGMTDAVVSNRRSKSVTVLLKEADAPQPTVCLVPRVVRRKLVTARAIIRRAHCTVAPIRRRYSGRVRRGRVIAQTPVPGSRLPADSQVALIVSRGARR
jgi:hypothetical protein